MIEHVILTRDKAILLEIYCSTISCENGMITIRVPFGDWPDGRGTAEALYRRLVAPLPSLPTKGRPDETGI